MGLFGSYLEGDDFKSEAFNNADLLEKHPKAWLIRPCSWYKEEYKECSSIHGKIHQYFIFGKTLDCSQWKQDHDNCLVIRKDPTDVEAITKVIESEERRIATRIAASKRNDIWDYRTSPPSDWNAPLNEKFRHRGFNYLEMKQRERVEKEKQNKSSEIIISG